MVRVADIVDYNDLQEMKISGDWDTVITRSPSLDGRRSNHDRHDRWRGIAMTLRLFLLSSARCM